MQDYRFTRRFKKIKKKTGYMWKLATEIIESVFVLFKTETTKSYYFSFKKKSISLSLIYISCIHPTA